MLEVYKGMIYQGKDYSDRLEVSNFGNIRNSKTKRVYKLNLNSKSGYYQVCVSLGSRTKKKVFKVHKAVAETFIPNPDNLPVVNHKDGVKTNCFESNLEWCTHSENSRHSVRLGLQVNPSGSSHPSAVLTDLDKAFIKDNYLPNDRVFGSRALGRKFNVSHSVILNYV